MLVNFFNSEEFCNKYRLSFSYSHSESYRKEFEHRVKADLPIYPLHFIDFSDPDKLPLWIPYLWRKVLITMFRVALGVPALIYEIVVLYSLLKRLRPDILHINNGGYPAALSARAAAIAGRLVGVQAIIMVVNNMALDYKHYLRILDLPVDKMVVRSVNRFVTGSRAAAVRLRSVLSLPGFQVQSIHNGVTLRAETIGSEGTRHRLGLADFQGVVFGVVALMVPRKGHQILLESILKLSGDEGLKGGEFKIFIEGEGPLREILKKFVDVNKLTQWVTFVGSESNIVDFMSALDVLIFPSVQDEDFPNVILEAMALGKPVIASRLAGTPEQVIDRVTGLLVEPRDVAQLADAILLLTHKSDLRHAFGISALQRFGDYFTSQIALGEYMRLYNQLTENSQCSTSKRF